MTTSETLNYTFRESARKWVALDLFFRRSGQAAACHPQGGNRVTNAANSLRQNQAVPGSASYIFPDEPFLHLAESEHVGLHSDRISAR